MQLVKQIDLENSFAKHAIIQITPTKFGNTLRNSSRKSEISKSMAFSQLPKSQNDLRADVLNGTVWLDAVPADFDLGEVRVRHDNSLEG